MLIPLHTQREIRADTGVLNQNVQYDRKQLMKEFIAYYRVSTQMQGINGLGMAAQKTAVERFLNGMQPLAEFAEVETGKRNDRVELQKAITLCRKQKATLVIARLDRLTRNAAFLLSLRDSGVDFICCDMPHADKFTIGILALVAEKERDMISERTKAGLAAAKRRGIRLGNPRIEIAREGAILARQQRSQEFAAKMLPVLGQLQKAGVTSLRKIAECLNARGFKSPSGKEFTATSVFNLKVILNGMN
jgi:DNA invertase Pin-like site-specific DNA recombinase